MCAGDKIYGSEERSMFQALIDQAHAMIQRLYACAEKGRNDVPLAVTIRYSEYEAWETTAYGIVRTVFGPDNAEVSRWRALADRRAMLLGEARRSDVKRGEFFGLIDYFNLAIGVLREYDAAYQCELNSTNLPARRPIWRRCRPTNNCNSPQAKISSTNRRWSGASIRIAGRWSSR